MERNKSKIVFTKPFGVYKKGEEKIFLTKLARKIVEEEKAAKFVEA